MLGATESSGRVLGSRATVELGNHGRLRLRPTVMRFGGRMRRVGAVIALIPLLAAVACTGSTAASTASPVTIDPSPLPPPVSPAPATCPHALPDRLPRHAMPGVAYQMVPGTPGALVICVSGTRTVLDRSQLVPIAERLNHLKRVGNPHIFACPVDLGPTFALFFDYPDGSRLLVEVDSSGCRFASNGRITGFADTPLLRSLHRLTS
jgi:hypothetical protein